MKKLLSFVALCCCAFLPLEAAEIRVSAAASLKDALTEIAGRYERESGDRLIFNFGASNLLARQIEEGAPADIFFSADEAKVDGLAAKSLIDEKTRKTLLSNTLVIVVLMDAPPSIRIPQDLAGEKVKRLALADPKAVPAGIYAKEYLEKAGLWTAVEKKVIPTENVRAALAAVESGNVDAGMVYQTDARISQKVRVVYAVPMQEGPAIRYVVTMLREAKAPEAAGKFLAYLASASATEVFEKGGFIVLK